MTQLRHEAVLRLKSWKAGDFPLRRGVTKQPRWPTLPEHVSSASTTDQRSRPAMKFKKKGKVRGKKASQEIGEGRIRGKRENWPKIVWIFGCFGDDVRGGTTLFVQGAVASRRQASSQCAVKMPGWERVDRGWRASVVVVSTLRLPGRGKEADSDGSSKA